MQFTRKNIEFKGEGAILRGWLYEPTETKNYPLIVMAHGYNCIKELYLDKYAELFASNGLAVLVYDHQNFGESDGLPRQELDPWQQVRNYRNAITFAQQLPNVNPNQIGIWGTSYSGGHVLVVAAIDKRVKCVVSQVPTISGYQTMLRRTAPGEWENLRTRFNEDRQSRYAGNAPTLVSMITNQSTQTASHASADAFEFFTGTQALPEEKWRFEKWHNEITLRSIEMYSEYEPGSYIKRISPTPLLMIIADNDVVSLTDLQMEAYNNAHEPKKVVMIKGDHFAPYQKQFDVSSREACEWFIKYLKLDH